MSVKIIADSRDEFPENVRDEAKEVDGKYEVDGNALLKKHKEILKKNSTLTGTNDELTADVEAAKQQASEFKTKARIPAGQKLVPEEIAELGEAAKAAEIGKDELPTLKTAKTEIEGKYNGLLKEKEVDKVAEDLGFNKRFKTLAREKNLDFVQTTEKVDGKDVQVWNVKGEGDAKTKVSEFVTNDPYFKEFADTFKDGEQGKKVLGQESGKGGQQTNSLDKEIAAQAGTGRYSI